MQELKRRQEGREDSPGNVSMTFLTDVMKKGYSKEEIFAVLVESDQDRKRRRVLAKVTETVEAHRLQQMKDLLTFKKLATWRRMNGFDRVADGEDNWCHGPRSLPPTPEEYTADLRAEVNTLRDSISMPRQKVSNLINAIEQGKVSDEEFAILKRLVEKRGREAAQMTVTVVDTVQYCSSSPQTPKPSPAVCAKLENNEGRMDPERGELKPPSADTGLETPGQQCPPNEGTWEKDRTIADGHSLVWHKTKPKGETFLHPQRNAWTREPSKLRQTQLSYSRVIRPKTRIKAAKRTSNLTPVEKERRHRFETRL